MISGSEWGRARDACRQPKLPTSLRCGNACCKCTLNAEFLPEIACRQAAVLCAKQGAPQSFSAQERRMSGKTMKALLLRKHGGLEDLEVVSDYPAPRATEGHVVIRVCASS